MEKTDSYDVQQWLAAEKKLTKKFFDSCNEKEVLQRSMQEYIDFPKFSLPSQRGENYYFTYNTGLDDDGGKTYKIETPGVYKLDQENPLKDASLFFDPKSLGDKDQVSDSSWAPNFEVLGMLVQSSGSDWGKIKIFDAKTRKFHKDQLDWCKHSGMAWTKDSKGFFYQRYDAPKHADLTKAGMETDKLENQKVYYHLLG